MRKAFDVSVNLGAIKLRLPIARYVETTRGYRFEFGRLSLSQSTFLLLAAIIVGLGGGFGAVAFRYLIFGESRLAMGTPRAGPIISRPRERRAGSYYRRHHYKPHRRSDLRGRPKVTAFRR